MENFIPFYNVPKNTIPGYMNVEEYDRHCGFSRLTQEPCLVCPPKYYKILLKCPAGRDVIWTSNVKIIKEQFLYSGSLTNRAVIVKSLEQLFLLGALTDEGKLSDHVGLQMARFPLEPFYAKAILVSFSFNCSEEMLIAVAMLSVESIFYTPCAKMKEARTTRQRFCSPDGDHITLVNHAYKACLEELQKNKSTITSASKLSTLDKRIQKWCKSNFVNSHSFRHAINIHRKIHGYVQTMGFPIVSCGEDWIQFRRCLVASFFLNAACKQSDGTYRAMENGQLVSVHPSSVLFGTKPGCVIFNELIHTNQNYVRNVTRIDALWLAELAPQFYASRDATLTSAAI